MRKIFVFSIIFIFIVSICTDARTQIYPQMRFDFEQGKQGWEIPWWAWGRLEHVGKKLEVSSKISSDDNKALQLMCDFPSHYSSAAMVEYERKINLEGFKEISADIFLPYGAVADRFKAKIILVTESRCWIESRQVTRLMCGKWNRVSARLDVSNLNEKAYWKSVGRRKNLLRDIDKVVRIILRIECYARSLRKGTSYKGPVYIDNIIIK